MAPHAAAQEDNLLLAVNRGNSFATGQLPEILEGRVGGSRRGCHGRKLVMDEEGKAQTRDGATMRLSLRKDSCGCARAGWTSHLPRPLPGRS